MTQLKPALLLIAAVFLSACESQTERETSVQDMREDVGLHLSAVLDGGHRSEANRERDQYRHPMETLTFFDLSLDDRVMEINPGGGWYMEILGPLLFAHGQYIAATPDPDIEGIPRYFKKHAEGIETRLDEQAAIYGSGRVQYYDPQAPVLGEPGSVDKVLTFRNVHNWINAGTAEAMFSAFAEVLKPGGVLGLVQHRAPEGADPEVSAAEGYVPESEVIALAEQAGLVLAERSEINANPEDSRNHPMGVWTLPPTLRMGEAQSQEYLEIGESDRMTLRFIKP